MKKIILLLILMAGPLTAQTKGDNTIVVKTTRTPLENLEAFKELLQDDRFFIKKTTENSLATEMRNSKTKPNWSHQYMYQVQFRDGDIIIMPYWTTGVGLQIGMVTAEPQLEEWKFSDKKNINGFIYHETLALLKSDGYTDIEFR